MVAPLSDKDLDYLEFLAANQGQLRCLCRVDSHGHGDRFCDAPAVVTIEIHVPHICRHPAVLRGGYVNRFGTSTQMLCGDCYVGLRAWADSKIAQSRALCQHLSQTCQRCGYGPLLEYGEGGWPRSLLAACPVCHLTRIEFSPVCGGGFRDKDGKAHGCGAALNSWRDVIRAEKWEGIRGDDEGIRGDDGDRPG